MGDGFFYKLKTLIGIEEIDEEDPMEETPASPTSLERKPMDSRGSYMSARNENREAKDLKDNRVLPMQNKNVNPNTNQFKMVVIEPKSFDECPKLVDNLKAKKPKREDWEQKIIDDYQADFIKKFQERNGYDPDPAYVASILDEIFPKNWTASIEELTEGEADDDSLGDKSSIMDSARSIFGAPHKKTPAEERLAELRDTWSDSWKEIYDRVLLGGESIVSIARERDVNESAVRKTTNKIRKAIAEDPELNRLMK
jgi:hypothetical protein